MKITGWSTIVLFCLSSIWVFHVAEEEPKGIEPESFWSKIVTIYEVVVELNNE